MTFRLTQFPRWFSPPGIERTSPQGRRSIAVARSFLRISLTTAVCSGLYFVLREDFTFAEIIILLTGFTVPMIGAFAIRFGFYLPVSLLG